MVDAARVMLPRGAFTRMRTEIRRLDRLEATNLRQLEMLNQRGGRSLSVVDLIRAGTLDREMAAFALCSIADGRSLLTAARPGGVGKTTLMSALLAFLAPGESIRTVGCGASRVPRGHSDHGHELLLCHEIGNGPYFGYLWGEEARALLQSTRRGVQIAANLHADTIEELRDELARPALGVDHEDVERLGLFVFMVVVRQGPRVKRRVSAFYAAREDGHHLLWRWNPKRDRHDWVPEDAEPATFLPLTAPPFSRAVDFLSELTASGVNEYAVVRERVREFLTPARSID